MIIDTTTTSQDPIEVDAGDESHTNWFKAPYQSIAIRRESNQQNRTLHQHDFIELVIILNGEGTHIIEGSRHRINAGDTFVVLPHIQHAYADTAELSLINILIRNQHLQTLEHECNSMPGFYALFKLEPRMRALHHFKAQLQLSPQALGELSNWLDSLEAEAQYTTPLACSRARAYLQLIVGNLCMQYEALGSLDSTKLLLVVKCIHYMHARLNSAIHLSDLTREAGMSERSLSRNFQATVGQSPIEYLLHLRLQRTYIPGRLRGRVQRRQLFYPTVPPNARPIAARVPQAAPVAPASYPFIAP
jgi:hypothetical protein